MREYSYRDIKDFSYESKLLAETNGRLMTNFKKVAEWIREHCPELNGKFNCAHNINHWTRLTVENGKAFLEYGSHGWGWDLALSEDETAVMSPASLQQIPYAFAGVLFADNARLEEFLIQWPEIKKRVIEENNNQMLVYGENFEA